MSSAAAALLILLIGLFLLSILLSNLPEISKMFSTSCMGIKLSIGLKEGYTCYNPNNEEAYVMIRRGNDDLELYSIWLFLAENNAEMVYEISSAGTTRIKMPNSQYAMPLRLPDPGDSVVYIINSSVKPSVISIAPILKVGSRKRTCPIHASVTEMSDCS